MSRIFVTGGSGFIGTNLIQSLIDRGDQVVNYDIKPPRNIDHNSVWRRGDILDPHTLIGTVNDFDPEYFIHLAARTDLEGRNVVEYPANTDGVLNIINSLKTCASLKRVFFTSSRLVCRIGYLPRSQDDYCPDTYYGESKVIGENLVRENVLNIPCTWTILRPTSIWGPWFDTPYKEFFLSILNSYYIHPKGQRIFKSFGYVGNSVYMIEKMLFCESSRIHAKTLYLTDYPPLEVKKWADLIAAKSGKRLPAEVPLLFLRFFAALGDLLKHSGWKNPPLTRFRLNNLMTDMIYETSEVESICGQLPYSVEQGVELTLEWLKLQK